MQYLLILFALLVALPAYGQTQIPASKVTGIPAQLEEGGNQEMDVEGLPTSCAENQIPKADATGGLVCAADEDSGAGSGGATDTVAADTGGAATGADILIEGGTNIDTTRSVDTITIDHDGVATSATLLLNNADLRWDASAFCYFYDWNNNTTKDNGDFCLTHQDFYASDYTTGSTTGGIQEAFDAAVPNANGSIGVIHLPCGTTTITTPLVFGNAQVAGDRPGFILKGCGSVKPTNVGSGPRGTTIVWDDAATDTDGDGKEVMIRVSSRHWKMQDFTLIGDEGNSDTSGFATTAFHGILWRADNEDSQVNTVSHLENVYMWDFEGSSHFYDGCRDAAGTLCDETDADNQPDGYKGQSDQVHIYGGGAAFSRSCGEIVADGAQHISYDSFECWSPDYASFILNASGSMTLRNIAGTMQGDDTNHPNHSQAGGQYAAVLITPAADNFNVDISSNTRFEQAGMHGVVVSGFCSEDSGLTPQDRTPCIFDDECGGTCSFDQVGVGGSLNVSGVSLSMGKTGEHDAAGSTTVLTDADANFPQSPNSFESRVIYNVTDGESCTITASTATTLTCAGLSGGASWDSGDDYHVGERYALYANMEGVLGFNGSTFGLAGAQPANTTVQISNDTADGELAYVGNKTNYPGGVVMNFDANVERTLLHTSAAEISALTSKATPVTGDHLLIEDSAASDAKKRITYGSLGAGDLSITGEWDFSGGGIEIENGTTPPACTEGQIYQDTDATTGQQLLACEAGTFVQQGGGGGGGFFDQTAGVLHPTTSTDDLANDATGTNWRMTNLGALTASSVTLDPADDAAMTLTTATYSADVSIGITGSAGPESIMDLNVDVGGAETKLMEIDGVAETVEMERPLELRNGTSSGELRIWEPSGSGTNNATFIVPPLALDTDYTLPTTDGGVDEFLQTDGAGVLTWAAPAGSGDVTSVGDCLDSACFTAASPDAAITFDNATSGTVTLQTVAGALGTVTASLPAETGTILTTASAATLTGDMDNTANPWADNEVASLPLAGGDVTTSGTGDATIGAGVVEETMMATEDFGDFACAGGADDCEVDASFLAKDLNWTGTGTTDFNGTVNVAALTVDDAEASASTTNRVYVLDDDNATGDSTCALAGTAGSLSILDADETATDDYQICDGTSILLDLNDVTSDTELAAWTGSANIVTVGTITSGVWTGTDILDADVADTLTIDASSTVDSIATTDLVDKSDTESIAGAWTKLTTDLTIDGVEVDYEAGGSEGYPRLAQSTTPPTAGCDAAAEVGRLYFDTDADTDGSVMVCKGAGPSWVEVDDDGGAGGFVSFDFTGNDGAPNSVITDGNTLTFTGGTNIDTTDGGAGVDTLTIDLDLTGITNTQALYDSSDQLGGMAQLTHDGTNVTLDVLSGDTVEATLEVDEVYNNSGATIHKCAAVYISGFNVGADLPEITVADSDTAAEMPSLGLVQADISNAAAGFVVTSGMLSGVDTAVLENWTGQEGDPLYVAPDNTTTTDGNCDETLTETRPSGATDRVQSVARIIRVNATTGELLVQGAGRSNDVPNLLDGNLWVGNGSNVATSVTMGGDVLMDNAGSVTVNATHAGDTHAEDDLTDDLPTVLSNVTTMTDGSYCQGNAGGGFDCDVATLHPFDDATAIVEDGVDGDKELRIDVGSNAAGVAGILTTAFTVPRVLALPDVTDTLASNNNVATMTNKNMDYQTGTSAPNYPRLAQSTTPPTGDCDAAAELGRLYFDTDSDTDGEVFVCAAGPAWKAVDDDGGAGGFTSFDVQGDDGAPNAVITDGNVLIVSGGNAITTEDGDAGADTLSIAVTANSIDHDELGSPLTMAATDVLNFDAWEDTDANGFILPTGTTSCANVATAGQACWRESDNTFWVGDGTAPPTQVGAGGSGFFDQTTGVLHPTTATDHLGNDSTGTNWLITDDGDVTANSYAAADQEASTTLLNEMAIMDDDSATGDSLCNGAQACPAGEICIRDVDETATDDFVVCEGGTVALSFTNIDGSGITNTAGVLSADLAVVAPLASPTFTGTVTVPQPFTIGAISMTSTATELNLLDGVTDIATQGELDGFVGSSNIVTVGTITTGTWTGTDIAVADGGTGVGTFTSNGILIGDGGNALDVTAAMTNGQVLVGSTGADPVPEDIDGRSITPTTGAGTLVLDADEELYRDEEGFFILDGVLTAGEEVLVKANGDITLVKLSCVALGGSTPTVTYTVVECSATTGGSCVSTGLTASLSALGTQVEDTDFTGGSSAIEDLDWWGLEATTLTTEPNTVNCTVEFTRND